MGGGYEPQWGANGRELYYLSLDRKLMAVSISLGVTFGPPRPLFQTNMAAGINAYRKHYVVSRDGRRFLINTQTGDPAPTPIIVWLNWTPGLQR